MPMTPDAKRQLSATVRALRARLLDDLHASTEGAYRLGIRAQDADLPEAQRVRRKRLDGWLDEQVRAEVEARLAARRKGSWADEKVAAEREKLRAAVEADGVRDRFRRAAEKQAASTLLNRLVFLRLLEAAGLRQPVVTGGWDSRGYKDLRSLAPALVHGDETEGYALLLRLVFEDLAGELPGLFGPVGVADLVPVPAATLRHVVEALDDPALASCWDDDMTLGWVYQYWNDPERERIDAKLNAGGKVEPHEIASKTQMFTERYMVDWLLQNSLGPMWLAMCQKHGWTPDVEADGTLDALEERRAAWRAKREAGQVALTALMPLRTDAERRWAYYVPQPIPNDAVDRAPETVRDLRLLDPACGSGHFLVVAFDLLLALYREEARHRGEADDVDWSERACVERILEHNLAGLDLDPRAVQIAAAALWLKAKTASSEARPSRMDLVASALRLASLPDDDPALVELRREVERETGIPGELTDTLVHALRGADHLGSLLRVDRAVTEAVDRHDRELSRAGKATQGDLWAGHTAPKRSRIDPEEAKATLLDRLEVFLARHTGGDDLGLRLRGEQLAAGVRFVRMVREGRYDLVVGNPPYQGTSKMADPSYVKAHYPKGKADLYAAFLERGLQLAREGGTSALLTMRNWMFIKQYTDLRTWLLETYDLRALGDFDRGAFEEVPDEVVSVVVSVFRRTEPAEEESVALQPTPLDDRSRDSERTQRKRAGTLSQLARFDFNPLRLRIVPEWPLVYWWCQDIITSYTESPLIGEHCEIAPGVKTGDDGRFTRLWHEVRARQIPVPPTRTFRKKPWQFYIKGAGGAEWFEPITRVIHWRSNALQLSIYGAYCAPGTVRLRDPSLLFRRGVAFSPIGSAFSARLHRVGCVFGNMGSSVFSNDNAGILCLLNSSDARAILTALNPSLHFEIGDVSRLPSIPLTGSQFIVATLDSAFTLHESHREPSVEFTSPGPSPWRHAQDWAQAAVDRPDGAPLPPYDPVLDPEPPTDHVSFALGVALGRFGPDGEGILDPATADLSHALPHGLLFLDGTLDAHDLRDGLGHPAARPLHHAWTSHGHAIDRKRDLRTWLRARFFGDVHRQMYENRPIHWPLTSRDGTFVAWVNIHRWDGNTLKVLLADHLEPARKRLVGERDDLRTVRDGADPKAARAAEARYAKVGRALDELDAFLADVVQCTEKGPLPPDAKTPPRQVDARYVPDLDDGVMINSAALWPLLDKQWKDPKKWWKELAAAKGRKDYDWSHLAMRYWPDRVDDKCQKDPSLGVAHGCFWRYHPARAWAWELRLQDEIDPGFRIEEGPYRGEGDDRVHRARYLEEQGEEALAAVEKEVLRRRRKQKAPQREIALLEPGLWSHLPHLVWDLELRLTEKQGVELRVLAPDESTARAAFEARYPARVREREALLATLDPADLFDDADPTDADDEGEE